MDDGGGVTIGNCSTIFVVVCQMIQPQEILRRRDMRDVFTFTIDPADAKDFDDALSFRCLDDGLLQVGVHIADVTHYVTPGSEIDEEAYRRGTSVYLVDKVIPMLPEELCNYLCSLRPDEDKLCMSVIFTMTPEGQVVKHKLCRTVIHSDVRLTYDQAQEIIKNEERRTKNEEQLADAIHTLNEVAKHLRNKRFADGSLYLEQDEVRFRLDENGEPVEIYFEHPNEAHHLIEEFMLLANRTVATMVGSKPFVYRIHDKPDQDKLKELHAFQKRMGDKVQPQVIEILTIRAMAKAVYSTHNIGHYGLAFSHYTHFTSPIRRYPDMLVHRLLDKYILSGKGESWSAEQLEDMCQHCTDMEIQAQAAERDSIKEYQAKWMHNFIGEELDGHISGVTDFGLFVQIDDSRCEGLIRINSIRRGEFFQYDEKNYRLIAVNSGETFTLGDPLRIRVVRADAEKRQVDFILADEDYTPRKHTPKPVKASTDKTKGTDKNKRGDKRKGFVKGKKRKRFA